MDAARSNQEKEGVTESSRIISNPDPVAFLSLQICLTLDYYVEVVLTFIVAIFMLYKVYKYTYPLEWALAESGGILLLQCLQFLRLFVGSRGNKTEHAGVTVIFILLTLVTILGAAYFA